MLKNFNKSMIIVGFNHLLFEHISKDNTIHPKMNECVGKWINIFFDLYRMKISIDEKLFALCLWKYEGLSVYSVTNGIPQKQCYI